MPNQDNPIFHTARRWWIFFLFGGVFVFGGLWVFMHSGEALFRIDELLRYIILTLGIGQLILSVLFPKNKVESWWHRILGVLEVGLGVYLILMPGRSVFFVAILISFWLFVRGLFLIGYAFRFRQVHFGPWFLTLIGGLIIILMTYFTVQNPWEETVTRLFWVALNMLLAGLFHMMLGLKLRALNKRRKQEERQSKPVTGAG